MGAATALPPVDARRGRATTRANAPRPETEAGLPPEIPHVGACGRARRAVHCRTGGARSVAPSRPPARPGRPPAAPADRRPLRGAGETLPGSLAARLAAMYRLS